MHTRRLLVPLLLVAFAAGCSTPPSNGERIYQTGSNARAVAIKSTFDRSELRDQNITLSCATCHGEDRKGRRSPLPELGPFAAPPLTASALGSPIEGRRPAYTRESLRETLRNGRGANGRGLHYPMPRWEFDEADARDLADYLLK